MTEGVPFEANRAIQIALLILGSIIALELFNTAMFSLSASRAFDVLILIFLIAGYFVSWLIGAAYFFLYATKRPTSYIGFFLTVWTIIIAEQDVQQAFLPPVPAAFTFTDLYGSQDVLVIFGAILISIAAICIGAGFVGYFRVPTD
jgi:hypothetical protein